MAGAMQEKYEGVGVEVIYKGFLTIGNAGDTPKPPDIAVNGKFLGKQVTAEELENNIKQLLNLE